MKKLKWKRGTIKLCTQLLKHHDILGYIHGQLGVHKLPNTKPQLWSITHIVTGMNVLDGVRIAFTKMADVKEFASKLLDGDSWYISDAGWGNCGNTERHKALQNKLREVLITDGYKVDERKYSSWDNDITRHMCDCGKIAERYILAIGNKWKHKCLECEPNTVSVDFHFDTKGVKYDR